MELFEDLHVVEVVDEDGRPVPDGTAGAKVLINNLDHRRLPLSRYELPDRISISPDRAAVPPSRRDRGADGRHAHLPRPRRRDGGAAAAADGRAVPAAVLAVLDEAGAVAPPVAAARVHGLERELGPAGS